MNESYDTRMKHLAQSFQDDPILLALHESATDPNDGRKWSDILYPRRPSRKERRAARRLEMQGNWRGPIGENTVIEQN